MPNTRSQGGDLIQRINEIERFINVKRRARNLPEVDPIPINQELTFTDQINQFTPKLEMAALRPLRDYAAPSRVEPHSSIAPPAIEANNFELKSSLVQAVQQNQFSGSPADDPNLHLSVFVQYADTVKANNVSSEAIRLRLFPFSLRDRARSWLQSLPSNSITTWDELKRVFLARYFPPSKTAMLEVKSTDLPRKITNHSSKHGN